MYLLKRIIPLVIVLIFLPASFYAQEKNFIYIQSEKNQPFYVILNNKTNSSSLRGYLILPQIRLGKHLLIIGFPKNIFPEQQFVIDVTEDKGYSLKRNSSNGWQLFDLNNFTLINPVKNVDSAMQAPVIKNVDAAVVETPKTTPIAVVTTSKLDSVIVHHKTDTLVPMSAVTDIVAQLSNSIPEIEKKENSATINPVAPIKPSKIILMLEKVQATGIDKIYVDSSESGMDTVAVYIPFPATSKTVVDINGQTTTITSKQERTLMTDDEFRKTRLSMASAPTDDDMIAVAVRSASNKLLETRQVKNLSTLFLNEGKKVLFFKALRNNLKDSSQFSSLVSELSDVKNIAAFNALIKS